MMKPIYHFHDIARLPMPGDNVAVATRLLPAGTTFIYEDQQLTLDYTVMEGHRFAIKPIAKGEPLLSWELPFGAALEPISAGQYVINQGVLDELGGRLLDFDLPAKPNFREIDQTFVIDEDEFQPADPLPLYPETRTFMGYRRSGTRGVGTRNTIVLLGTTSRTSSYVRQLARRFQADIADMEHIDGVVPVAHTEGGAERPNNLEFLLRTLSGFVVHPNVGAVLIVDEGDEVVTNAMLETYMLRHNYPLDDVTHRFLTLQHDFHRNLDIGEAIVREWLPQVGQCKRTEESIAHLNIALQCGGSDAFSGISANPLLGWISRELIRYGGTAVLAETDELIGAESYVLQKVRDLKTARKFLQMMSEFRERASWHGANAEGNPSGGNKYRGLYNITLKSIGAARKKDPETRLDYAIEYGAPAKESGYYFMDSPGNDLESIAGQVASGCNLIFFTTGNGSITNFPFVPTIKVVTTTERYKLLENDMDVNAGQYLDGLSMDELGKQTFDLTVQVASGKRSVGEKAGHSQVQIWRDWRQTDATKLETLLQAEPPSGQPLDIVTDASDTPPNITFTRSDSGHAGNQIGLILPTSLCSGQVGHLIAMHLNRKKLGQPDRISQFVALAHTEGCGNSAGQNEEMYARTMVGYATHPLVKHCLLLEHGCEKTHNAFMRHQLEDRGQDPDRLGYASIQLDGGIDNVTQKVERWFAEQLAADRTVEHDSTGLHGLRIGLMSAGTASKEEARQLARLTRWIVQAGGTVVVPENSPLLRHADYRDQLLGSASVRPSLAYGDSVRHPGFHIMEAPTSHWVETMTGLAATGVELIVASVSDRPLQTHPFVPVMQLTSHPATQQKYERDLDLALVDSSDSWALDILQRSKDIIERRYVPELYRQGNIAFQFTRGELGVSL